MEGRARGAGLKVIFRGLRLGKCVCEQEKKVREDLAC